MNNDRLRELFAKRFEADGDAYLFRASLGAPGIRVSAAERDGFVSQYVSRWRMLKWGGLAVMLAVILLVVWASVSSGAELSETAIFLLLIVMGGLIAGGSMWLWYAPNRALAGRLASAPGRSKEEARKLAFRRMPWSNFGVAVGFIALATAKLLSRHVDLLHGWSRLWLAGLAALAVLLAVQAFRKWRSERGG
jgi:hypothetical protein